MSESWKRNLAVPFFTQRDNTYIWQQKDKETNQKKGLKYPMAYRSCNITSLCMILHYWGITDKTPNQMIEEVYSNIEWNWSISVTGYEALVYWANLRKIAEHYTQNYKDGNGNPIYKIIGGKEKENNFTLEFAREQIARGFPIMLSTGLASVIDDYNTYKGDGHIVVIRGFTNDGDVILNDPYGIPVDNAGKIKPLTGEAKGQNEGKIIAGYYYNSPAASVGDNIVIKKAEFDKICKDTGIRYISIEGPLWQHPCDPMTEPDVENCYPIKTNNYWHDGIHLQSAEGFRSIGSGRLVAARNADVVGNNGEVHGSSSFALVRYQLPVSENPFFYALYMHIKTVDLKSELKDFMETGSVSGSLRGTWYEQIFNNLLPRYKIFDTSSNIYDAIYRAEIIEEGKVLKIVKTDKFVNFENRSSNTGTLSKNMKAYLLPVQKFQTICDIDSYSSIENLKFMVAKDDKDFIFKHNKQDYYVFYCGNGSGRRLCCCKASFFANYDIYNEASYSYYVKKLYSLYKGEVVSFPEVKSNPTAQKTESNTKDYVTTSSILARELVYCKSDVLEYGFRLGDKIVGMIDSYSRIKSDGEQLVCDIVQLLDLYSNTGDKKVSESFEEMMQNYVKERKKQIENLLCGITKKIDNKNEPLNSFYSSIKTDKEWILAFYHDAEKRLNVKEILGMEGFYVSEGNDINDVEYDNIRKPFEEILDKYKEYDVLSVVAICEYLMIKFVSIPQKNIAGGKDDRFVYREGNKSETITSLFKIWEKSLTSEQSLKSVYKDFFNERYIDNFIEIPKGAKIGYGSKIPESKTADSIHFEIFSGENLLKDSEELVVDVEDFYTPKEITKAIFDTNCFTEEYKKTNLSHVKNCLLTSDDIKKIYTEGSAFQKLISCHISEWEKLNYRKESVKSMFNIKKKNQRKEKVDLKEYFDKIYNGYCWFNKNLLNKDDKKITDKLYFYHPVYFIEKLVHEDNSASVVSKNKNDNNAKLVSVNFVDDNGNDIEGIFKKYVNLPDNDKYVDGKIINGHYQLGNSFKCRVTFDKPGKHSFYLELIPKGNVIEYSENETKKNPYGMFTKGKQEVFFTGSSESEIITLNKERLCVGQIGGNKFTLKASTENDECTAAGIVETWRLLFYVNVYMQGIMPISDSENILEAHFSDNYIHMKNVGSESISYQKNVDSSMANGFIDEVMDILKKYNQYGKYCFAACYIDLSLTPEIVRNDKIEIPRDSELSDKKYKWIISLDNKPRLLWHELDEKDWFISAFYKPKKQSAHWKKIKKDRFVPIVNGNFAIYYTLSINLDGLPNENGGIMKLKLRLISKHKVSAGFSFSEKPIIAVSKNNPNTQQYVLLHEVGHRLKLVPSGDAQEQLDASPTHYDDRRGHHGNHCFSGCSAEIKRFDEPNLDKTSNLAFSPNCIMFGETHKYAVSFCQNCKDALQKVDLSIGVEKRVL